MLTTWADRGSGYWFFAMGAYWPVGISTSYSTIRATIGRCRIYPKKQPDGPGTERTCQLKSITVGEVHDTHVSAFETVREFVSLDVVISMFAARASVQAVFVVDDSGNYKDAITWDDLLKWVTVEVAGGESSRSMSAGNVRRSLFAANTGDLVRGRSMVPPVSESADLATALRIMMDSSEPVLPVVDRGGMVVGDLRVSEILAAALDYDAPSMKAPDSKGDQDR